MDQEFWFMLLVVSMAGAFFSGAVQEGPSYFAQMTFVFALIFLFIRFVANGGLKTIGVGDSCIGWFCMGAILLGIIGAGGGGGGPRLQYVMGRGVETVYDIGFKKE